MCVCAFVFVCVCLCLVVFVCVCVGQNGTFQKSRGFPFASPLHQPENGTLEKGRHRNAGMGRMGHSAWASSEVVLLARLTDFFLGLSGEISGDGSACNPQLVRTSVDGQNPDKSISHHFETMKEY